MSTSGRDVKKFAGGACPARAPGQKNGGGSPSPPGETVFRNMSRKNDFRAESQKTVGHLGHGADDQMALRAAPVVTPQMRFFDFRAIGPFGQETKR